MAVEDNNVDLEQIELLGQLADKQEKMRSKRIALTTDEQTMFNSIMRLPLAAQVTALRGFIPRVERKLSEMSVRTVPAAQKETTAASINVAGACAAVAAAFFKSFCVARSKYTVSPSLTAARLPLKYFQEIARIFGFLLLDCASATIRD